MRHAFAFAPAVLAAAAVTAQLADPIEFSPAIEVGSSVSYRAERSLNVTQTISDQPDRTTEASLMLELVLERQQDAADGTHIFSIDIRAASFINRLTIGEDTARDTALTIPPTGEPTEAQTAFLDTVRDTQLSLAINEQGEVLTTGGLEPIQQAWFELTDSSDDAILGLLSPEAVGGLLQPVFDADGAIPSKRPGSGWQRQQTVDMPPVGALNLYTSSKLTADDPSLAVIEGNLEAELMVVPVQDPAAVRVELNSAEGSSSLTWDTEADQLITRSGSQEIVTTWSVGERTMRQTQTSTQQLTAINED